MVSEHPIEGRCGFEIESGGYCERLPDSEDERGYCAVHPPDEEEKKAVLDSMAKSKQGNQNATRHGLYSDRENYVQNFPNADVEFIEQMHQDLCDRFRRIHGREPDMFDREVARNIAIDLEQIPSAYKYVKKQTWVQKEERIEEGTLFSDDVPNILLDDIRQQNESVIKRMKDLGLLNDPETKKASALNGDSLAEAFADEEVSDSDLIDVDFRDLSESEEAEDSE
jgi:hypothetical protein